MTSTHQKYAHIDPKSLQPNPFQPRKMFDEKTIKELAESIRENGLLQPPVVSHDSVSDYYFIIAGERRVRACIELGWESIPVLVQGTQSEKDYQVLGLLENLQREDLSPMDVAEGYQALVTKYGLTQEALSKQIGKARSTIANTLRLTSCTEEVKQALREGRIQEGHALAILSVEDPELQNQVLAEILFSNLNVRQALHFANKVSGKVPQAEKGEREENVLINNPYTYRLRTFSKEAKFIPSTHGGGRILVSFETDEELDRFMATIPEVQE